MAQGNKQSTCNSNERLFLLILFFKVLKILIRRSFKTLINCTSQVKHSFVVGRTLVGHLPQVKHSFVVGRTLVGHLPFVGVGPTSWVEPTSDWIVRRQFLDFKVLSRVLRTFCKPHSRAKLTISNQLADKQSKLGRNRRNKFHNYIHCGHSKLKSWCHIQG